MSASGPTIPSETHEQENPQTSNSLLRRVLNSGAWTAIFTGILVLFTALLWRVNDRATETSVAAQRAFISSTGPGIIKDVQGPKWKGVKVYYLWGNSGTTPAKDAVSEWNMSLGSTIPTKGLNFDNLPQNERLSFVMGPKSNFQMVPVYLSTEELEMVADGKKRLFFWGWVTYRDIFSATPIHLSEFCTDITSAVWTTPNHTALTTDWNTVSPPCPVHNCYDEDCEDYTARIRAK